MTDLRQIVQDRRAYYCLDCGKCTGVCPITRHDADFSPRRIVEMVALGAADQFLNSRQLWLCLTCQHCSQVCPSDVRYSEFIRDLRAEARGVGLEAECTHGDVIQTWMRLMTDPDRHPDRLGWLDESLRVSETSDTIYWVGCLPHYDTLFEGQGFQGTEIARSAVKVLNYLGIEPMVLADERCCGHDALWEGDEETFRRLAEVNLKLLAGAKAAGAKRIVTTCPECARTLAVDYPELVGPTGFEVLHIAQLLAESDLPAPGDGGRRVTYQDPCRLGRYLEVYDAPRQVIDALGLELVEMAHHRQKALCCGTSCWTACGATNKAMQETRLREARATGADLLVTACAKCQIHFRCALGDDALKDELEIEMHDLITLVAEALP